MKRPESAESQALVDQYVGLRGDAEYFRTIAVDEPGVDSVRRRIETAICWMDKYADEERSSERAYRLHLHLADLYEQHAQLLASNPGQDEEEKTLGWLRTDERKEALLNGMGAHVTAWLLSRTVEALHNRLDQPDVIVDASLQYLRSEEGSDEAVEQMGFYLDDTISREEAEILPQIPDVLESVRWQIGIVRDAIEAAKMGEIY